MSDSRFNQFRLKNVDLIRLVVVFCLIGTYILLGYPSKANAEGVGCVPGDVRKVNGPAANASVNAFSNSTKTDTKIYHPENGWHLVDWQYIQTNGYGKYGYSVDYVQANSITATESQLNEAYNSAIDLAGKYDKSSAEGHLRQARTNAVSYASQVRSSHRAVILTLTARGKGQFADTGSSVAGYLLMTLQCVGNSSPSSLEARIVERYLGGNRFYLYNNCNKAIEFSLSYRDLAGEWQTRGVYNMGPFDGSYLGTGDGTRVYLTDPTFYYYATSTDGSLVWSGGYDRGGFPMKVRTLSLDGDRDYTLYLKCS